MPTLQLPEGPIDYEDTGEGRPVVFLHGVLVDGRLWRDVAPRIAETARAIVPTLPLGAHTTPMPGADLSPPGLAKIVAHLLEALDLEDVVVVGNDTGGGIAQILVANHPERIGAAVFVDCDTVERFPPAIFAFLRYVPLVPGGILATAHTVRFKPLWRLPNTFGWLTKRPVDDELIRSWLRPLRTDKAIRDDTSRALRTFHPRHLRTVAPHLNAFDKPVVVLWSREDKIFPAGDAEVLARAFPNARIEWTDDAYTFVSLDRPEKVVDAIRGVLAPVRA